jgi:hypothetical protein
MNLPKAIAALPKWADGDLLFDSVIMPRLD